MSLGWINNLLDTEEENTTNPENREIYVLTEVH